MMTLKKIFAAVLLSLSSISMVSADTLGLRVGGGVWKPDVGGTFQYNGDAIDLQNDLFLAGDKNQDYVYALFEHPIPLIPNIKVSQTSLTFDGSGTAGGYQFGGTTYSAAVITKMVLDHTDATIYYSLLDNWFHLDLGLTAKQFNGSVAVNGNTTNIDKMIPLLYVAAGIELPFINNLFFGVESNALSVGDHTIQDVIAKVSYTTDYFLGFEVGVRTFTVELDNLGGNTSNMEFEGSFANVYIHF